VVSWAPENGFVRMPDGVVFGTFEGQGRPRNSGGGNLVPPSGVAMVALALQLMARGRTLRSERNSDREIAEAWADSR
jgi:hypothetical protein